MAIEPIARFDPDLTWFGGSGCLCCGTNFSNAGQVQGIQGVDLGAAVEMEGELGLCFECALQVGRAVGMLRGDAVQDQEDTLTEILEQATQAQEQAARDAAQARLDRDTVERLIGSVYVADIAAHEADDLLAEATA